MDFRFTEDQLMMAETARKLFADTATSTQLRTMLANGMARDEARWSKIVETGLTLTMLPDAAGGLGLAEADFVLIAEAAGYAALPEPLVESAGIATPLLAAIDPAHEALNNPADTLAIGHAINPYIADADTAAALLLHHEGATYLRHPNEVRLIRQESLDPFRRLFKVEWEPAGEPLSTDPDLWHDTLDRGALFMAAQCLGLAQRAIDIAVEYAKTREQFGKPIGTYQAVKHLLASAQVQVEFARPVVHAAAIGLMQRDAFSRARISHAKIIATEAADASTRVALQVHGAMGYSWEVDVHFLLKRSLALNTAWGGPGFHHDRVLARLHAAPTGPEYGFAHSSDMEL